MKLVYANHELPSHWGKSIFLAGPTPRDENTLSWRPEAISFLQKLNFDGVVFIPEDETGTWRHSYDDQIEWEESCLNACDCIVFWIPRELNSMPGFTTNIELGHWLDSGKVVVGFPSNAAKVTYIDYYLKKLKIIYSDSLEALLSTAVSFIGDGTDRIEGARKIPLYIFQSSHFQSWYSQQLADGNRLVDARVLWNYRSGPKKIPFFWAIRVNIFVTAENRFKSNELILSRPDIVSILAYRKSDNRTEICLIKEFRSPGNLPGSLIWELPGGSSFSEVEPINIARNEFFEETGLLIDKTRFIYSDQRQLNATMSTHKSTLFKVELTEKEITYLKLQKSIPHGADDNEKTYVEVVELNNLVKFGVDWATLGMIFANLTL